MRLLKRLLALILLAVVSTYLLVGALLYVYQAPLLFPAPQVDARERGRLAEANGATELVLTGGGETLYGWHVPGEGKRAFLYFHGNGESVAWSRFAIELARPHGYDVVVIDCPPQLGYLTMGALNAATAMLVTIHPQMVDVASMSQFLLMTSDLMSVIEEAGGRLDHDFIRYVITRHDPNDVPEAQIVALLRTLFGSDVLQATVWKSTAIANAGLTKQSLYELERGAVGRGAYDRALESVDAVNAEIAQLLKKVWGR